jgi:hypothetical protein
VALSVNKLRGWGVTHELSNTGVGAAGHVVVTGRFRQVCQDSPPDRAHSLGRCRFGLECSRELAELGAFERPGACVMPVRGIEVHQRDAAGIVEDDVPRLDVSVRHAAEVNGLQDRV